MIVWMLMFVLCSGALIYGRASDQPNELQELGFGVCDGDPCFMGIVPGETKWEDAMAILRKYDVQEAQTTGAGRSASITLRGLKIDFLSYGDYLTILDIQPPYTGDRHIVFLRNVIQQMGTPCAVGFLSQDSPRIFYPSMWVDVSASDGQLHLETELDGLLMQPKDAVLRCKSTPDFPFEQWKGFTTLNRYTNRN
jgi:hypothetical protein